MPNDSDYEIAAMFAPIVWGATGFRCDRCGHLRGYHLECRPRMWECADCHHQQSVVAGTLMANTKLPLKVWLVRGEYYLAGEVPTCAQLARACGIAVSTAWLLHHKIFAALGDVADRTFQLTAACRKPRKALGPLADVDLKAAWKALREGRARGATVHVGEHLRITPVQSHPEHPLGEAIRDRLHRVHRDVCIRWLPRWVAHLVDLDRPTEGWLEAILGHPPMPLVRLAPC